MNGTVAVDLQIPALPDSVPDGAKLDAIIHIETLPNVIYVGRPVFAKPNSDGTLFKLDPDGGQATRVKVQYGRTSVNTIQILGGLTPGDRVILNDTSQFSKFDRIVVH